MVVAVATSILLAVGRYPLIERAAIVLVGTVVVVTLLAIVLLPFVPAWAISTHELASGLWFAIPAVDPAAAGGRPPLVTPLAALAVLAFR